MKSKRQRLIESGIEKIVRKQLNEAAEVEFSELPPDEQEISKKLESIMKSKIEHYFDGIHGYVITFKKNDSPYAANRLDVSMLKKITSLPIRWIEYSYNAWSIGF